MEIFWKKFFDIIRKKVFNILLFGVKFGFDLVFFKKGMVDIGYNLLDKKLGVFELLN